jgi:predicted RecB family nuclease
LAFKISKSKYVAGIQCPKRLYLKVHNPELGAAPSVSELALLSQGSVVGEVARLRFPGGVLVHYDNTELDQASELTNTLISDSTVPAIFEATFETGNVLVRVDVLQRVEGQQFDLFEVKSATSMKEYYLHDLAIQYFVCASHIGLRSVSLLHLNRDYIYAGGEFDMRQLFSAYNPVGNELSLSSVPATIQQQLKILEAETPPDIGPGKHCSEPVRCEFFAHCNADLPKHHIASLPRLHAKKRQKLEDMGVTLISDIPADFQLSEIQARIREAVITGKTWISQDLTRELGTLKYPCCFMDFETTFSALPKFAEMRCYDHIPFQWSIHRRDTPSGELAHFEFIAPDASDHREEFISTLLAGLRGAQTIVVYNATFERLRLEELAGLFPRFKEEIAAAISSMWDLYPIVQKHFYHPDFQGSYSLKSVLPAIVPTMTYANMAVSEGGEAAVFWQEMVSGECTPDRKETLKLQLLEYCAKDTEALVKIVDALQLCCAAHGAAASG